MWNVYSDEGLLELSYTLPVRQGDTTICFVRAALLPAVGTSVVLSFGVMPGWCCFLRVTLLYVRVTMCRIILSVARVCRVGVWFGFVGSALLLAVGTW